MTVRYYSSVAGEYALTAPVTSSTTTIALDSGTGLPSSTPFTLLLDYGEVTEEIVTVTNVAGLNLTVTRGQDGTAAQSHSAGSVVRHAVTARDFRDSRDHEQATTAHGSNGDLVGTNNAQTLKNKTISGSSNTITNVPKSALPGDIVDLSSTQTLKNKTVAATNLTGSATDPILPYWVGGATGSNNVAAGAWERVTPFGAANSSRDWGYGNGQWTVPVSGIYHIDAGVGFEAKNGVGSRLFRVLQNNSFAILNGADSQPGTTASTRLNSSRTVYLSANDTLQFEMYQSSGGVLAMSSSVGDTYFGIYFVCPAA